MARSARRHGMSSGPTRTEDVAVNDFDGDGHPDLATVVLDETAEPLRVRTGRGDGTFSALQRFRLPGAYGGPVAADFDQDGRSDLATLAEPHFKEAGVGVSFSWAGLSAPPCVVGALIDKPLQDAQFALRRDGCRTGRIRHAYSRRISPHDVISLQPKQGTVLPSRASVDIVVSRGRRSRKAPGTCGARRSALPGNGGARYADAIRSICKARRYERLGWCARRGESLCSRRRP